MAQTGLIGPIGAPELHVMSLNIRRRMPHLRRAHPDRWEHRAPLVAELLEAERPTVLGMQETLPDQQDLVLVALGSTYSAIGFGRGARRDGERGPIVYDRDRLELLDWAQSALSDSPDISGSRSWGNPIPRIVVSARFRDAATGRELLVVNTHLDPFSPRSRVRSASAIRSLLEQRMLPTIVMGDFNSRAGSATYRALTEGDLLRDSWTSADRRLTEEWGTYANYREPRSGRARIDWILVTPSVDVGRAAVNATPYLSAAPSDHLPVHAVVELLP